MIIKNIHTILFSLELHLFLKYVSNSWSCFLDIVPYLCLIIDFQLGHLAAWHILSIAHRKIFSAFMKKKDCIPLQRIIVLQIVAIYSTKIYRKKYRLAEFCRKLKTVFVQISHLILYTIHLNIANYGKIELHQQIQLLPLLRF